MDSIITEEELENRLGPSLYSAVFNDWNLGESALNLDAVQQICDDAASKVRSGLGRVYDVVTLTAANPAFATELRRITLEVATAMCAQRNPKLFELDGFAIMRQAEQDLMRLRSGATTLEVGTPAPGGDGDSLRGSGFVVRSKPSRGW